MKKACYIFNNRGFSHFSPVKKCKTSKIRISEFQFFTKPFRENVWSEGFANYLNYLGIF